MTSLPVTVHRGPLDAGPAAEVRALAAEAAATDGVEPLSEQPLLALSTDPRSTHVLAPAPDGSLAGYAQVGAGAPGEASAELVVRPSVRRRGVGGQLLAAARDVAQGRGSRTAPARHLSVWSHGDLPAARALAASAGLSVVRELWLMSAELARPAARALPPLPRGVTVRAFVPGRDEEAWRWVNSRAFEHHPEQGRMTRQDLQARLSEPWFDAAGFLLAERDGVLLGSIWTKVHPAESTHGRVGEIYAIGIDPDAQGLGLGGALTARGLAHLTGLGLRRAILYTEADNAIAIRTYARAGFARTATDTQYA